MFAPDINTTKNQLATLFNEIKGVSQILFWSTEHTHRYSP